MEGVPGGPALHERQRAPGSGYPLPSGFRVSVTRTHTPLIAHPWEFGPVFPLTPSLMETAYIPFLKLLL